MSRKIDEWISAHMDELTVAICESVRIPSVKGTPEPGAPFGKEVTRSIEHSLDIGKRYGMETRNMDGYIGLIDYGEGEETLGIMCHMDVVPEGEGWKHPPYGGVIADDEIHGRGTLDDKGPAICALYALAAVKECGLPMKRKVRIMLGGDEESGWGCMKHYRENEKMPDLAFSPDAEYPLVNSEKGIAQITMKATYGSHIELKGGERANVVCDSVTAIIPQSADDIEGLAADFANKTGYGVVTDSKDGKTTITVTGVAAHASMPEMGKNAIQGTLALLNILPIPEEDKHAVCALHRCFGFDMHGESAGIDCEDASGRITVNPGIIKWDENGYTLVVDMRVPTTQSLEDISNRLCANVEDAELIDKHFQEGHFVARDSELVTKLLEVYEKHTGRPAEPLAIGGGTYARAVENAVAFGCERPGVPALIHMPNESIRLEDVEFNVRVIADAIIALACE